jgi:aromatic-amino-acid transaminase
VAASERILIAASCSKAFGLYRERVGVLLAVTPSADEARKVQGNLEKLSRNLVSMAPSHGAAVVATVLSDAELRRQWRGELESMHARLLELRGRLARSGLPALDGVADRRGLFSMLPLTPEAVDRLAAEHAVYLPRSGRINVAGLRAEDVERFANAVRAIAEG